MLPNNIEAVVTLALSVLSDTDQRMLVAKAEENLIRLSPILGVKLRNEVGLWRPEADGLCSLLASSVPSYFGVIEWHPGDYTIDPDGASGILLLLVRRRLLSAENG